MKTELEKEIENFYEIKYEETRIRSKIHKPDNEIPTKFFFNFERRNGQRKTITEIKRQNDTVAKGKEEIIKEVHQFYNELWGIKESNASKTEKKNYLNEITINKIKENDANELETLITGNEIEAAINQLNKESSPGSNGLTKKT